MQAHLRVIAPAADTARFEQLTQRRRAVGNTVSSLTGLKFEAQTFRFINERVIARPSGWF